MSKSPRSWPITLIARGWANRIASDAFESTLIRMTTFDYSDDGTWEKALTICNSLLKYRESENHNLDFANVRSSVNIYNQDLCDHGSGVGPAEWGRVAEVEFFL